MTSLLPWFAALVGLYAAWLFVLYMAQRSMVYPGTRINERPPLAADRQDRQVIWLETASGPVEAWFLPPPPADVTSGPAVIIAHGNAELIDSIPGGFLGLRARGYAILLVEYPGYGDSTGKPTVDTVTQAFVAAYDVLASRADVDARRIVGMGRSLGGGAICALAAQRPLRALLLVSTFADLPSLSRRYLAPARLASERFDNESVLRTYEGPVFIAHGTRDELIPVEHPRRNAAATARSRLVTYDARHDECPVDFDRFWQDVDTFLAATLPTP